MMTENIQEDPLDTKEDVEGIKQIIMNQQLTNKNVCFLPLKI